jgi:hypothetical protein
LPAGQAAQKEAPLALNLPAAQDWQQEELVAHVLNVPAAQLVHAAALALLHAPEEHTTHEELVVAPCVPLNLPAEQAVQEVLPAALQLPSAQHVPAPALEKLPLLQTLQADAPAPE